MLLQYTVWLHDRRKMSLFSNVRGGPGDVAEEVIEVFETAGLTISVIRRTGDLVQMIVGDGHRGECKVDLGVFWRAYSPVILDIGPVLHPDDAVAGKMDGLFNRWAPRDFLDIDTILRSGRYSQPQLITVATEHNPGFDVKRAVAFTSDCRSPRRRTGGIGMTRINVVRFSADFPQITAFPVRFPGLDLHRIGAGRAAAENSENHSG